MIDTTPLWALGIAAAILWAAFIADCLARPTQHTSHMQAARNQQKPGVRPAGSTIAPPRRTAEEVDQ